MYSVIRPEEERRRRLRIEGSEYVTTYDEGSLEKLNKAVSALICCVLVYLDV